MNLGTGEKALDVLQTLKDRCRMFNGNFTLLWHNNRLVADDEVALYKTLLEA
jgi:hypothetical protein